MMNIEKKKSGVRKPYVITPGGQRICLLKADTFTKRLLGIHLQKPNYDQALWFPDCRSIHTFLCPVIGVVFMRNWEVLVVYPQVLPNVVLIERKADGVIEFLPGSPLALLNPGEKLVYKEG